MEEERKVLFTGTSCQIVGLKNYLRKDYEKLLAVDVVCHGVPSPKVWQKYLKEVIARQSDGGDNVHIVDISFRNKKLGWKKFSFSLVFFRDDADGKKNKLSSIFTENPYMNVFLSNLSLRPSCYACPAKAGKSGSDVTIADYWGIEKSNPDFDDDKGVSLVLIYSDKGLQACQSLSWENRETSYNDGLQDNMSIEKPVTIHINRSYFFQRLRKGFCVAYLDTTSKHWCKRLQRILFRKMKK